MKNKGASGGIDGETLADFEAHLADNLKSLRQSLEQKNWVPEPYLRVNIPKSSGELRKLGLLSVRDKIVQQAIRMLVEPRFEKIFVPNSYGYRKSKGHNKAVKFALNCMKAKGITTVAILDIDNYFDTISHELLFKRVASVIGDTEILRLISLSVKMGVVTKKLKWSEVMTGVPQGAVLSPLLSNFYLHAFDQFVLTRTKHYVRYADDFLLFCNSREEADTLISECTTFLEQRLKLRLNAPRTVDVSEGFEFLGIFFKDGALGLTEQKMERLFSRINELSWKTCAFEANGLSGLRTVNSFYAKLVPSRCWRDLTRCCSFG